MKKLSALYREGIAAGRGRETRPVMKFAAACWGLALISAAFSCGTPADTPHYRPGYHFTAEKNWLNDPSGLVYLDGEYHLFYQHNPFGNGWNHMSWGHAVSRDLVRWKHLPVALQEEGPWYYPTMMFTGSAVIDRSNTCGLCAAGQVPCMVAVYTSFTLLEQTQSIAYSADRGRTFTKYAGNPVLDIDTMHFRDPKVFRHEESGRWIMAVNLPKERKVRFYSSPDLKKWEHQSDFGPAGDAKGIWECPDLFRLPVLNRKGKHRWVLVTSLGQDGQGPDMQYFIGDFDGTKFINENPRDLVLRLDYGFDYYAAVSWNDLPESDGRRIMIGWVSNWKYAGDMPTSPWKGAMSLPREVGLRQLEEGVRLVQNPVREIERLRTRAREFRNIPVEGESAYLRDSGITGNSLEIDVEFADIAAEECGIVVCAGERNRTVIGYNRASGTLFMDRTKSGDSSFSGDYREMGRSEAPLELDNGALRLRVFVDRSIVEVYANGGRRVMTNTIFPGPEDVNAALYSRGGTARVRKGVVYVMKPAL